VQLLEAEEYRLKIPTTTLNAWENTDVCNLTSKKKMTARKKIGSNTLAQNNFKNI